MEKKTIERQIVEAIRENGYESVNRLVASVAEQLHLKPLPEPPKVPEGPKPLGWDTFSYHQIVNGDEETEVLITVDVKVIRKRFP